VAGGCQLLELEEARCQRHRLVQKLVELDLTVALVGREEHAAARSEHPMELLQDRDQLGTANVDQRVEGEHTADHVGGERQGTHVGRNRGVEPTTGELRHSRG